MDDLKKHFSSNVLECASRLQSSTQLEHVHSPTCAKDFLWPIDSVAEAILHCIENLPQPQVHSISLGQLPMSSNCFYCRF